MPDVFDKCSAWKDYRIARATGLYPYFRAIEQSEGTEVVIDGKRRVMAGSNNYLGLASDPRVKEAALAATRKYGTTCSGSRLLNGTLDLHEQLELRLARFLQKEAAVVVSTGFQANLAALSALLGRHDTVFSDRGNHASLVDGIRLSFGQERKYRHGDLGHLEELLEKSSPDHGRLIVTDGVFSMEGDVCPLPGIVSLARKHGARVLVDDAHGTGVLGANGRGTAEHFGLEHDVDLVLGTFSKSFASLGGVLAGPFDVVNYVKHKSRPIIFSASMTPGAVAAALAALEIIEREPERRARLLDVAETMHNGLRALGFDTGVSVTPVVPVLVGDQLKCFRFWKALFEAGVFANPVIPPAVEPGRALIRTSFQATHTDAQLDRVLEAFEQVGRRLDVIPETRPLHWERVTVARPGVSLPVGGAQPARAARNVHVPGIKDTPWPGREVAGRLFDAVESFTWRATQLPAPDLRKLASAPLSYLREKGRSFTRWGTP
jgi:8-amino-7-oxononanoate synthase